MKICGKTFCIYLSTEREESIAQHKYGGLVWDQVFLREDLGGRVAGVGISKTGEGDQIAGGVEYRGSGKDTGWVEDAQLSGVFDIDLCVWVTLVGRGGNESKADRRRAETGACERGKRE